jgi:anaerobic selenocysteine-containing dehydrogenase
MQGIFYTCRFPDVVLPASPNLEKESYVYQYGETNAATLSSQVLEPQEGTKPDWQIIHHLLQALPDREILDALKGA